MDEREGKIAAASDLEGAFTPPEKIFSNKPLLENGYVPGADRFVCCNEEIQQLAAALNPAVAGKEPNNAFLYGQTGTGKSLCAKFVTQRVQSEADKRRVSVGIAYIDCSQEDTETRAVRTIASQLNDPDETGITIPDTGFGRSRYYSRLWDVLESRLDVAIVVLDEVDFLHESNLLLQLSRAKEAGKLDRCSLGIVGISNKINYRDRMSERVKSSLQEREIVFVPYSATELQEILANRTSAFKDGVLEDSVLVECAKLAVEEHGDARRAISLLRHAGEIALEKRSEKVTVDHVREAYERVDRERFQKVLAGATDQQKAALLAVVSMTTKNKFNVKNIYKKYEEICSEVGLDILTKRRIHDLLREWEFLQVLSITRTGGGRGNGSYLEYQLVMDPSVIRSSIKENSRFSNVAFNTNASTTWSNV